MKSSVTAFILWLFGLVGLCGLHRFYLGRPFTGLLSLVTLGLFGIGQLIDIFLLGSMVREANILFGLAHNRNTNTNTNTVVVNIDPSLLQAAQTKPEFP